MLRGLLGLLFAIPLALEAGPVLRIVQVDSTRYPDVQLLAEVADSAGASPAFSVREGNGSPINPEILSSRKAADRLILTLVFDATGSIPAPDFKRSQMAAVSFLGTLQPEDRAAIYQINGGPLLVTGFVPPPDGLKDKIIQLKRTGKTTRVYDALHAGIMNTRDGILRNSNTDSTSPKIARGAVILFTDGRDEGSYLTDEDCTQLTELGERNRIPVFTVLYGRARGERTFQRLSLRTGGVLLRSLSDKSMKSLADQVRKLPEQTFLLRYKSPESGSGKKEIKLSVTSGEIMDEDSASFVAPPPRAQQAPEFWYSRFTGLTIGGIALVALGLLIFLASVIATFVIWKKPKPQLADISDSTALLAVQATESDHMNLPEGEVEKVDIIEGVIKEELPHPMMQYLRETAYQILQDALRDAPRYASASLIRKKDGFEREYDLFLDNTAMGSGRWASVRVEDSGVAKVHGKVKRVDGKYVLYDLMGGSGIYLNGQKLLRPRALRDGDEIKMARSLFLFRGKNPPQESVRVGQAGAFS
ncbi:MAG: FHA domain-containing protein [Leptospirales bacterium]|nr:FHA domain-containing protein [Leptospirales bacterium]